MNPTLAKLRQLNRTLKEGCGSNYFRLLELVVQDHSHHQYLSGFLEALASRDLPRVWREADSLSAQVHAGATQHFVANQIAAIVKKYPWDPSEVQMDPKDNAVRTFLSSEKRCRLLNKKFALLATLRNPEQYFLNRVRGFIEYVIGKSPDLLSIYGNCDFGPGASLGCNGDATSFGRKVSCDRLTVTPGAISDAFNAWFLHDQLRDRFLLKKEYSTAYTVVCVDQERASQQFRDNMLMIQHNKVSFVPKTAKTHRAIAVEPLLNTFLQKGADVDLRAKLLRIGIDLRDQSKNCHMARSGSLDNSDEGFATIDLSSASDSISIGLCREVLPPDWFNLLNRWRSPSYIIDSSCPVRYEKFCSMGNGFCFPLQTLIFVAIAFASGCGKPGVDFRVYGDDIIVRKKFFSEVVRNLRFCGFKTNASKTFSTGPFRESCGSDWYEGEDVRPYTLDHKLDSLESLFKIINLSRRSFRTSQFFSPAYQFLVELIPVDFRFWRPFPGNPDTGIDPLDYQPRYSKYARLRKGLNCYEWLELAVRPKQDLHGVPNWGVYAAALRGHDSSCLFTFRRRTKTSFRYVASSGAVSSWAPPQDEMTMSESMLSNLIALTSGK